MLVIIHDLKLNFRLKKREARGKQKKLYTNALFRPTQASNLLTLWFVNQILWLKNAQKQVKTINTPGSSILFNR